MECWRLHPTKGRDVMAGALSLFSSLFSAIGSFFGFARDRSKLKNAPAIVANVNADRDLKEKQKIESAIEESEKKGTLDDERKIFRD